MSETNPPPVAPVVTDEMVHAAMDVYSRGRPAAAWKDCMRAAITAALQASNGHPTPEAYEAACKALWKHREENERLMAAGKELADQMCEGFEDGCGHFPEDCFGCQILKKLKETSDD